MTAVDEATSVGEFGKARRRKEDARLITGRTRWTDNITLPGMVHLAMVRSPVAHGTIASIETAEAKQADHGRPEGGQPPGDRPARGEVRRRDRRRRRGPLGP